MQAPVSTFLIMRLAQDNSIMDNIDYKAKVGFVPAGDGGRVTIVLSFASESPSLLGAEVPVYARVHPISAISRPNAAVSSLAHRRAAPRTPS